MKSLKRKSRKLTPRNWRSRLIQALESKKYFKGSGSLRSGGGYCCLGVLCDISKTGKWVETAGVNFYQISKEYDYTHLPKPLGEKLKIKRSFQQKLISANDTSKTWDNVIALLRGKRKSKTCASNPVKALV